MKYSEKNEFIKERWVGVPILNFEGGPGFPLFNVRGVSGPTFKLWGGSWVSGPRVPGPRIARSRVPGLGPTFAPCPLSKLRGVPCPTFKVWGESRVLSPEVVGPGVQVQFLHHALKSLQKAEACLEPERASTAELFCEYA